ncbi:MAG TPA: YciI family protein [Roseiflexaceae bacterium]|nr:YciI family protein [Roseiflexaceae bacterium]
MKYVFLAYADEKYLDVMSTSERDALDNACLANNKALRKSGHFLAVTGLHSSRTATTVRVYNGQVSIIDGPVAETKEQIIGIFTVNARDLNEAIQVATTMPQVRGGPIEVRPILAFDQHDLHLDR